MHVAANDVVLSREMAEDEEGYLAAEMIGGVF